MVFPHFPFTFSFSYSFRGCDSSSVWIWPVLLPHVLLSWRSKTPSKCSFRDSAPFMSDPHTSFCSTTVIPGTRSRLHRARTTLAPIVSISFSRGSTEQAAVKKHKRVLYTPDLSSSCLYSLAQKDPTWEIGRKMISRLPYPLFFPTSSPKYQWRTVWNVRVEDRMLPLKGHPAPQFEENGVSDACSVHLVKVGHIQMQRRPQRDVRTAIREPLPIFLWNNFPWKWETGPQTLTVNGPTGIFQIFYSTHGQFNLVTCCKSFL